MYYFYITVRGPETLRNVIVSVHVYYILPYQQIFRKYIIFSSLKKCICDRMKWLRGPDLARGAGRSLETLT